MCPTDSDRIPSKMSRVAPFADGDTGEGDGDIMDFTDAKENNKDHEKNDDMGVEDDEDGESNDDEVHDEEEEGQKGEKGKEKEKESNAKETKLVICIM